MSKLDKMKIIVVGLNHKTAPIEIREKLAFDSTEIAEALRQLKNKFCESEFVLLSTCNRIEIYCAFKVAEPIDSRTLAEFLSQFHGIALDDFENLLYVYNNAEAVRHLLTVTSSLDSMVMGEAQILGQVKESYGLACKVKSTGKVLNRLFHYSFATGKKIHTNTSISNGRVSVAGVAVELARQLFCDVSSAKVVVIGAGQMGELLIQHLLHVKCRDITLINRSYDRASDMAKRYGINAQKWDELDERIIDADIVVASAATKDYLFRKKLFANIMQRRQKGSLLIIDLAVPRNFDPAVNEVENIYLHSLDELSGVAEQNRKTRKDDIAKGMQIISEKVAGFMEWFRARDIGPLIGEMKDKFAQISKNEIERFFVGNRQNAVYQEATETMVHHLVNRLLHCVIKNIDSVAKKHGPAEAAKLTDSISRQADELLSESDRNEQLD